MKPERYGQSIPEPGDVVYRRGAPRSLGVVTDLKILEDHHDGITKANAREMLDTGKVSRMNAQVRVTWMNPNTGHPGRLTNTASADDWVTVRSLGECLEQLIDTTRHKLDTHIESLRKARTWALHEGLTS